MSATLHFAPQSDDRATACGLMPYVPARTTNQIEKCGCVECLLVLIGQGAVRLEYLSKVHGPLVLQWGTESKRT